MKPNEADELAGKCRVALNLLDAVKHQITSAEWTLVVCGQAAKHIRVVAAALEAEAVRK